MLVLIEHTSKSSRALLMERRTGALMGDVSMDEYGCVAISPLWLGGTAKQNSLYVVHDVEGLEGSTSLREVRQRLQLALLRQKKQLIV